MAAYFTPGAVICHASIWCDMSHQACSYVTPAFDGGQHMSHQARVRQLILYLMVTFIYTHLPRTLLPHAAVCTQLNKYWDQVSYSCIYHDTVCYVRNGFPPTFDGGIHVHAPSTHCCWYWNNEIWDRVSHSRIYDDTVWFVRSGFPLIFDGGLHVSHHACACLAALS